ncbi:MAG: CDP-alcohol phosphatidyltransferase family protein [Pirellulaceae bacterium]|jgi:phosphatidylglycerophosphate synthase|nr:CDP-alcohol phosphatidyltransferase family protein [Thermoguttaceae bacterium]MDI9443852.1 CDP-alcohol phosphatidyltransferase family protein [Planctomycetota bacterium]NLY99456.1 CDP-alcohol phosphatidyltransferase family protein [Pirellulaceae bacterium]
MSRATLQPTAEPLAIRPPSPGDHAPREQPRTRIYPISRWYLLPIAERLASRLAATRVRPVHVTLTGLGLGLAAAGWLLADPSGGPVAAGLVLAAWMMDRTDGALARRQGTGSVFGQWLDANVDELNEVAWHTAAAYAAAALGQTPLPWFLLIAFLGGKYLFMTGLAEQRLLEKAAERQPAAWPERLGWLRAAYHLPGDADIRLHLLAAALASGLITVELAAVAIYYNLRWIARFGLVARRLGGTL